MSTQRFDSNADFLGDNSQPQKTTRLDGGFDVPDNNSSPASTQRLDDPFQTPASATAASTTRVNSSFMLPDDPSSQKPITPSASQFLLNGNSYQVISQIASSGEAEVFLVNRDGKTEVLKYYFTNFRPKEEVITQLQSINRSDVLSPLDFGYYNNRFWETSEYMEGGHLGDIAPLNDVKLFRDIIEKANEAIHACHVNKIIHRDIKPVNIFFRDKARTQIVLGDFGIASPIQNENDYRVTSVNRTSTYAAPELFTNIDNKGAINNKVDFYALGISLLELWQGKDPFHGISEFSIMRIKLEGRINIPSSLPDDIETLIKGLITIEPGKRWGYEETKKWLRGEPVKSYYETVQVTLKPFEFDRSKGLYAADFRELAYYMEQYPQKAERHLYSMIIAEWAKDASPDVFSELKNLVEKEYPNTAGAPPENTKAALTKAMYILDADKPFKSFDGSVWYSHSDLAQHIEANASHYKQDLAKPTSSFYLFLEARGMDDRAAKYRNYFQKFGADKAFHLLVLDLQDNILRVDGQDFSNVQQLTSVDDALQQKIIKDVTDPNSKVSVWLDAVHNYLTNNINRWRVLKQFNIDTLRYALRTGGLKIGNAEVSDVNEFTDLLRTQPGLFTDFSDAEGNRVKADYWLQNYQQSSLQDAVSTSRFFELPGLSITQMGALLGYLTRQEEAESFDIVVQYSDIIKKAVNGDDNRLSELTRPSETGLNQYIEQNRPAHLYAVELLEMVVNKINEINTSHHALAERVLFIINDSIDKHLHADFEKLKDHSQNYELVFNRVKVFAEKQLAAISGTLPYLQHWEKEQKLINKRISEIDTELDRELVKEHKNISEKFETMKKDYLKGKVDFLEKGKHFYAIFTYALGWSIAFLFFYFANSAPAVNPYVYQDSYYGISTSWLYIFGFIFLVVTPLKVRSVRNRWPDTGIMGSICDPIHRLVGKILYRPILKEMEKDPSSSINQRSADPEKNELLKAEQIIGGKRHNQKFEAISAIVSLPNDRLEMELAKL